MTFDHGDEAYDQRSQPDSRENDASYISQSDHGQATYDDDGVSSATYEDDNVSESDREGSQSEYAKDAPDDASDNDVEAGAHATRSEHAREALSDNGSLADPVEFNPSNVPQADTVANPSDGSEADLVMATPSDGSQPDLATPRDGSPEGPELVAPSEGTQSDIGEAYDDAFESEAGESEVSDEE